jgi:hypothetical protein
VTWSKWALIIERASQFGLIVDVKDIKFGLAIDLFGPFLVI